MTCAKCSRATGHDVRGHIDHHWRATVESGPETQSCGNCQTHGIRGAFNACPWCGSDL